MYIYIFFKQIKKANKELFLHIMQISMNKCFTFKYT